MSYQTIIFPLEATNNNLLMDFLGDYEFVKTKEKLLSNERVTSWSVDGILYVATIENNHFKIKTIENGKDAVVLLEIPVIIASSSIKNTFKTTDDNMEIIFSIESSEGVVNDFKKNYTDSDFSHHPATIISSKISVASASSDEDIDIRSRHSNSVGISGSDAEKEDFLEDSNLQPVFTIADGNCGFNALALRLRDEAQSTANLDARSLLLKEMDGSSKSDLEFQKEFGPKVRTYACKAYHAYIEKQSDLNVVKKHHRQLYKYIEDAINKIDLDVSGLRTTAALVPDLTPQDKASIDSQVSELLAKKEQLQKDYPSPERKKTKKIRPPRTPEERLLRAQKRLGRHKIRAQKIIDEMVANPTTWVDDHTLNFVASSLGFSLKIEQQDAPPYELADTQVNQYFKKPEDAPVVHLLNTQGNHWTYLRHQPPLLRAEP